VKRALQILLAVVLLAAGFWLWRVLFPSDEARILRLLQQVAESVSAPPGEGNIGHVRRINRLIGFLTPDVTIRFAPMSDRGLELNGRDELQQAALAARGMNSALKVEFLDPQVVPVATGADTAEARLTAKVQAGNDRDFGIQPLRIELRKDQEFGWRIQRVESFRALKPE
jgi:hypothetical protein